MTPYRLSPVKGALNNMFKKQKSNTDSLWDNLWAGNDDITEHFMGEKRTIINRAHFDVLADGGLTFIATPNAYCLPYRFWKKKREILGRRHFGEEYPYTRKELKTLCRKIGIASYSFMGTPFKTSLNFIFPFVRWKESLSKRLFPDTWLDINKIRVAPKTFLDPYLGWMLILAAKKGKIVPGI
jgi:hypothetical protein